MGTDLKIEIFACKLFHTILYDMLGIEVVPDILEIYGDECVVVDTYLEACDDLFIKAVYCRSNLLYSIYDQKFPIQETKKINSLSEVYEYIVRMCDRDDIFGHLTVFERMLATSEFAVNTFYYVYIKNGLINVLRYGHILWAMYFDKFTDEFYEKGGWNKLKREAKSYTVLSEFDQIFHAYSNLYLQSVKEATVNYYSFKNAIDYQERKHKYSVHVSKLWIKFRIENLESYINIPLSYETSVNAQEAELLLEDVKLLLNPSRCNPDDIEISTEKHQGSTFSTEISYSEIHYAPEEKNVNHDDDTQIQHLTFVQESRIIDKTLGGFSHISTDYEGQSQSRCPTSAKEELTFDIIDSNRSRELDENNFIEIELLRQASRENSTNNSHIEQNLLPAVDIKRPSETIKNLPNASDLELDHSYRSKSYINKNKDSIFECFYEGNVNEKAEITNTDQVISIHQLEKTEFHGNTFSKVHANSEVQIETSETKDVSSISQIVASDLDGLSVEPPLKDFNSVNDNVNLDDERKNIRKAREDLRTEQEDPEIKNFLKMFLVLGDMEGIEFVLSTLENNKEYPEDSQESLSQQKKRSKKKMSRK